MIVSSGFRQAMPSARNRLLVIFAFYSPFYVKLSSWASAGAP